MLILTRKLGESITIGDSIKVSVLGIRGRQVRIGIEAPDDIVVHREEIYVKIQKENRKAQSGIKGDLMNMVNLLRGKVKGSDSESDQSVVDFKNDKRNRKDRPSQRDDRDRGLHEGDL